MSVLPGAQSPPAKGSETPWLGSQAGPGRKLGDLGNWSGEKQPTEAFGRTNNVPGGAGMKRAPAAPVFISEQKKARVPRPNLFHILGKLTLKKSE